MKNKVKENKWFKKVKKSTRKRQEGRTLKKKSYCKSCHWM